MRPMQLRRLTACLVALTVLLAPARPALAGAGNGELQQVVNGYHVELVFTDAVAPGVTAVQVHLTDAQGLAVRDARVQIVQSWSAELSADAHGAAGDDAHAADAVEDDHLSGGASEHVQDPAEHGHSEPAASVPADDHAAANAGAGDHGHDEPDAHDEPEGHGEPNAHGEAAPHTHDDSSLYQLSWSDAAGAYIGSVIFFQVGQWAVHVEFVTDGQKHAAEFSVDVLAPDRGGLVLAAFAGLNVAILGAAAVFKRKIAAA